MEQTNNKDSSLYGLMIILVVFLLSFLFVVSLGLQTSGEMKVERDTVYQEKAVAIHPQKADEEISLGFDMVTLPVRKISTSKSAYSDFDGQKRESYTDTAGILENYEIYPEAKELADSATVSLPLGQRIYRDSLYTAYVSGYRIGDYPRLDSLTIRQRTAYITTTVMQTQKRKPWSIGIGVGYGFTGKNFQPFLGATLQYKIIEF